MGTTAYPGAIDNFTDPTPSDQLNSATVPHAAQHANLNSAVEAIQTTLGTNPQGSAATVAARIAALEGGTGAAGMTWKGDYMPNAYSPGDTVRYQGDLWVCLNAVTGGASAPTPPDWERAVDVPAAVDAYTKAEADAKFATKTALAATDAQLLTTTQALDTRVPGEAGSNQPAGTPPNGYVWVNTSDNSIKVWNGTAYVDPSNAGSGGPSWAVASGGTESTITDGGKQYKVHAFNANGTLTVATAGLVEVLIVGAGCGSHPSAPGNAGDILRGIFQVPAGPLTVTVGAFDSGAFRGDASVLGTLRTTVTRLALGPDNAIGGGGAGTGQSTYQQGYTSTFTGSSATYSTANTSAATANTGNGGAIGAPGSSGVVLVRTPI